MTTTAHNHNNNNLTGRNASTVVAVVHGRNKENEIKFITCYFARKSINPYFASLYKAGTGTTAAAAAAIVKEPRKSTQLEGATRRHSTSTSFFHWETNLMDTFSNQITWPLENEHASSS